MSKKPTGTDFILPLTEQIESTQQAPKFKIGDRVRITKHKYIFSEGYT